MTDGPLDVPAAPWVGRRHLAMAIGSALLGLVVFASALAPALTAYDPLKPSFAQRLAPPWGFGGTAAHVLGTDNLGRDILARLPHGGRASLALAVSAVVIAAVVGVVVGLLASWGGEGTDAVIMRVADVQLAFPVIMLAIALVAVIGTNPVALVGVLALSGWVLYARTSRQRATIRASRSRAAHKLARTISGSSSATCSRIRWRRSSSSARASSPPWCCWVGLSFLGMGHPGPAAARGGMMLSEGRGILSKRWCSHRARDHDLATWVHGGVHLLGYGLALPASTRTSV